MEGHLSPATPGRMRCLNACEYGGGAPYRLRVNAIPRPLDPILDSYSYK